MLKMQINSNVTKQMEAIINKVDTFPNRVASAQQSALYRTANNIGQTLYKKYPTKIVNHASVLNSKYQNPIIVPNVEDFEGHIACSAASKSEIVIPLMHQEKVIAVLDVDSEHLNYFDEIDELYLSKIVALISLA